MRKALLLTDGSVDRALSLRQWLESQSEPIDLTVVYALSLPTPDDQPLKVVTYREAKRLASEELNRWLTFLPQAGTSPTAPHRFAQLHTEILLGEPELVLTIHLLIRRYDYLLLDASQHNVAATFLLCQHQISTQLWCLSEPEYASFSPDLLFNRLPTL